MGNDGAKAVGGGDAVHYLLRADLPGTKKRKRLRNDVPPGASVSVFMRDGSWSFTTTKVSGVRSGPVSFTRTDEALVSIVAEDPDAVMKDVALRLGGTRPADDDIARYAKAAAERMASAALRTGAAADTNVRKWERPLPKELQGISPDSLGVGQDRILVWLSEIGGGLNFTEARAKKNLMEPNAARATVLFVHADSEAFRRHHGVLDELWDSLVDAATERVVSEETTEEPVVEHDEDRWLDPLPSEFDGVDVGHLLSEWHERKVHVDLRDLKAGDLTAYYARQRLSHPDRALSFVVHIDRNQGGFKQYEGIIRPRWNAWVQTARRALPGR